MSVEYGNERPLPGVACAARVPRAVVLGGNGLVGAAALKLVSAGWEVIRRRGCAAAGVRLAGQELSAICRLDLYGAWRLLTVFESPDRCVLLLVAEHPHVQPLPSLVRSARHQ